MKSHWVGVIERARLDRELKLLKELDHTNIVRLFSVYDDPLYMYFVMELCHGGHLGNLLSRQPLKCVDELWARKLSRQLISAGRQTPLPHHGRSSLHTLFSITFSGAYPSPRHRPSGYKAAEHLDRQPPRPNGAVEAHRLRLRLQVHRRLANAHQVWHTVYHCS